MLKKDLMYYVPLQDTSSFMAATSNLALCVRMKHNTVLFL